MWLMLQGEQAGGPLALWLRAHGHNYMQGLLGKSKLAQYACDECHRAIWSEARILGIGSDRRYRK
jgi:hypothetical protein